MMNHRYRRILGVVCYLLAVTGGIKLAHAQTTADATSLGLPAPELIRQRIQEFENKPELSDTQRAEIVSIYNRVLNDLEADKSLEDRRDRFTNLLNSVDQDRKAAQEQLRDLEQTPTVDPTGKSLEELTDEVQKKSLEAQKAAKALDQLNNQPQRRSERRLEIPRLQAELTNRISELDTQIQTRRPGDSDDLTAANKLLYDVQRANSQLELDALREEVAYYDASEDLLPIQIDIAKRQMELVNQELQLWQSAAAAKQDRNVKKELVGALEKEGSVPDELKSIAQENLQLVQQWSQQGDQITKTNQLIESARKLRVDWDERFDKSRTMIASQGGVTSTVGEILRNQSRELPDVRQLKMDRRQTDRQITELRDKSFQVGERLADLADLDASVRDTLSKILPPLTVEQRQSLKAPADALFEQRVKIWQGIRTSQNNHLQRLLDLALAQDTLVGVVQRYKTFIDERVLWIPSSRRVGWRDFQEAGESIVSFFESQRWRTIIRGVPRSLRSQPFPQIVLLALAFVLGLYRSRMSAKITELGQKASSPTCRRFDVTVAAVLLTAARALVLPLLMFWLSVNLRATNDATALLNADPIAQAMREVAVTCLWLGLWYGLVRPGGVCGAHFEWSDSTLKVSRGQLRWFSPVIIICSAIYTFVVVSNLSAQERSIGRFAAVIGLLAISMFSYKVFAPRNGVFSSYLLRNPTGWLYRLRKLWYPLLFGTPIVLALFALTGYTYTATRLVRQSAESLFFLGALFLAEAMALRWVKLNRRSLAMTQARERLAEMARGGGPDQNTAERTGGVVQGERVDLAIVNEQTRRLLKLFGAVTAVVGLYFIWHDIFPALTKLDEVRLWQTSIVQAAVATTDSASATADKTAAVSTEWITLRNLLGSLAVLFLTFAATKNIPGLLEISVLQRLPLDAALRYAITTVTRYAIIIGGVTIACANLGFGWQRVQWLVAAVSVGLGFGLQEIFANFVSGLILLFERPLRAGDVVTVGDVTGKVVQIKMRATTIQDWDRKELVVPNKEFITSQLLNWTLTDSINRIVITVGVAYGSDPERARQILLDAANAHPEVLDTPAPLVSFDLFGDSSLNFTLRAFLPTMDDRLRVTTELHSEIYKRFSQAGIEIPFPQRDIHIRSSSSTDTLPGTESPSYVSDREELP